MIYAIQDGCISKTQETKHNTVFIHRNIFQLVKSVGSFFPKLSSKSLGIGHPPWTSCHTEKTALTFSSYVVPLHISGAIQCLVPGRGKKLRQAPILVGKNFFFDGGLLLSQFIKQPGSYYLQVWGCTYSSADFKPSSNKTNHQAVSSNPSPIWAHDTGISAVCSLLKDDFLIRHCPIQ